MYYTIQNGSILTAENIGALANYYDNVQELPSDYEVGKYIVVDNELALNPNYEAEQAQKEAERINSLTLDSTTFYKEILRTSNNTKNNIQNIIQSTNTLSKYQKESLIIDLQNNLNLTRGSYFINIVGKLLNYTTEDLNYLFENKIFPN